MESKTTSDDFSRPGGNDGPLHGVRVVDFTTAWAGPMSTRIMAYLGAQIVHVEGPGRVDSWRLPLEGGDPRRYPSGEWGERPYNRTSLFNTQNVGKLGLAVELKSDDGLQILESLIRTSDVVISNFSAGTLARLGLTFERLQSLRRDLIVLEMPAYGLTGPMSRHVALGPSMEAACGMAALTGYGDGRPIVTGPAYMDPIGAFNAVSVVLTALAVRARTGRGQHIEMAQCEAAMHWIGEELLAADDRRGRRRQRDVQGNAVTYAAPHDAFRCAGEDQWVAISVTTDAEWATAADIMGIDHSGPADALRTVLGRHRNRDLVRRVVEAWTMTQEKHHAAAALQSAGVLAAPVCDGRDVAHRSDLDHVGFFAELSNRDVAATQYQGLGLQLSRTPGRAAAHAPMFGEHNDFVLREMLHLPAEQVRSLVEAGVVADSPTVAAPRQAVVSTGSHE
jgi:crotonobetainyl-CoA:carnitine CoA-transferase CaiB-like acyl-CoA transferase